MPDIKAALQLTPALPSYSSAVLAFETENRHHFEQWISTRGHAYYSENAVRSSLEQAQWAAQTMKEYHYLAWHGSEIVGRVTLRGVEREQYHKATLGYRFSQRHGGRGYAAAAVTAVLEQAFSHLALKRLEALVIADNLPSQSVLHRCGFHVYGRARQAVLRDGVWHDLLYFEQHAPGFLQS